MSYGNNPYANPYGGQYATPSQPLAGPSYPGPSSSYDPITGGYSDLVAADSHRAAFDASLAEQSSAYTPDAVKRGGNGMAFTNPDQKGKARTTVLRKGGGKLWEDPSLMEWDPTHFRLFIGDLDPALSDDLFAQSFSGVRYPSFVKAKIIRDKYTNKGKGFGFVSYKDPEDFLKAWKEMNGKYVGTRPVKISRATTGVSSVNIGARKARDLDAQHKKKTGTVPYEKAKAAEAAGGGLNSGRGAGGGGFGPERDRKSYIRR